MAHQDHSEPRRRQKRTFDNKDREMDDSLLAHIIDRTMTRDKSKTVLVTVYEGTKRSVRQQITAYYRGRKMIAVVKTQRKED